jgi:hypothetical protein
VINFRFHLVSLVAVFLALAVGVVMGYGVLSQPTVEALENRIDTVRANADARRIENEQLQVRLEDAEATLESLEPFALTDRLIEARVVVVAVRGLESETMQGIVELARRGGASAPGILWIEDKWTLNTTEDRDALAAAFDLADSRRAALRTRAWEILVNRLSQGPSLAPDALLALADAGFVSFEAVGTDVGLAEVGGVGTEMLLVVGSDAVVDAKHVLVPAAQAAIDAGMPLAAAEMYVATDGGAERGALVALIRDNDVLAGEVATVDDLDLPSGSAAALLALADLLRGVVGHYGFGEGATAPAPTFWQP